MKADPVSRLIARKAGKSGLVCLLYHSIHSGASTQSWPWGISLDKFCEQIDLLKEMGWVTVCARDVEKMSILPPRSVCITFDDGYADNFQAFEALAR